MLSDESLEAIAKKIPARLTYAVISSWKEQEEDAGSWDDYEHVQYFRSWEDACSEKQWLERQGLAAYIVEPKGPFEEIEA